jgi:hypothetical protein
VLGRLSLVTLWRRKRASRWWSCAELAKMLSVVGGRWSVAPSPTGLLRSRTFPFPATVAVDIGVADTQVSLDLSKLVWSDHAQLTQVMPISMPT